MGSKGREENNTFYPTQREKITHFAQRGSHSTTACAHAFFSRNQRSHDKNATLGFGRVMAASPDSKRTVRAKHCWTHPSWGWVRSELSVLHPDVSCCLAKGEGRGGDYTTLSLSLLLSLSLPRSCLLTLEPSADMQRGQAGSLECPQKGKDNTQVNRHRKGNQPDITICILQLYSDHFDLGTVIKTALQAACITVQLFHFEQKNSVLRPQTDTLNSMSVKTCWFNISKTGEKKPTCITCTSQPGREISLGSEVPGKQCATILVEPESKPGNSCFWFLWMLWSYLCFSEETESTLVFVGQERANRWLA